MKIRPPQPLRGQYLCARVAHAALIISTALLATSRAEDALEQSDELPPLVISALRTPTELSRNPASVSVLDPRELEARGIYHLRDALNRAPGVVSTSTAGQSGAIGALFIRGTTTGYSQIVVDGMRLNDSNAPLGNFLGNAGTSDFGRVEVLRGPHGAIYGGESVGGVLWLETAAGTPERLTRLRVEGGSFNSFSIDGRHQGTEGPLAYFLSTGYEETDNDSDPSQDYRQWRTAMRADMTLGDRWDMRMTFRANDSYFLDPTQSENRVDSALATVQATGVISDRWTTRFHVGFHQEFYDNDSAFGNFGTDLRSAAISSDQEIRLGDDLLLLGGAFFHRDAFENTIGVDEVGKRHGLHAALQWQPVDGLTLQQSGRWEDYDAYGDEFTWRSGAAYLFDQVGLTLRGGIGSSFRTPSYLDLFGSAFGVGNPGLNAESATGWDVGFTKSIARDHEIEVTWFENRIDDRIRSFPAPPQNIAGTTNTRGVEVGLRGAWFDGRLSHHLAWTWTDASIADLPRNVINASLDWGADEKSRFGVGVSHLSSRSFGGNPIASATIARVHASRQLTEHLMIHARVENVFDERYELSDFFGTVVQGPGTGCYLGLTAMW